jgi:hypothetical protein
MEPFVSSRLGINYKYVKLSNGRTGTTSLDLPKGVGFCLGYSGAVQTNMESWTCMVDSPSWLGRKTDEVAVKIPVGSVAFESISQSTCARNGPAITSSELNTHTEGDAFEIYTLQSDRSPERLIKHVRWRMQPQVLNDLIKLLN